MYEKTEEAEKTEGSEEETENHLQMMKERERDVLRGALGILGRGRCCMCVVGKGERHL